MSPKKEDQLLIRERRLSDLISLGDEFLSDIDETLRSDKQLSIAHIDDVEAWHSEALKLIGQLDNLDDPEAIYGAAIAYDDDDGVSQGRTRIFKLVSALKRHQPAGQTPTKKNRHWGILVTIFTGAAALLAVFSNLATFRYSVDRNDIVFKERRDIEITGTTVESCKESCLNNLMCRAWNYKSNTKEKTNICYLLNRHDAKNEQEDVNYKGGQVKWKYIE